MNEVTGIVMTTVENIQQAQTIIEDVMREKLAACIQTREIESHYLWRGELCHDKEILIWFKTEKRLYNELEEFLCRIHPYEVPEIIYVPIELISKSYMDWIHESVK